MKSREEVAEYLKGLLEEEEEFDDDAKDNLMRACEEDSVREARAVLDTKIVKKAAGESPPVDVNEVDFGVSCRLRGGTYFSVNKICDDLVTGKLTLACGRLAWEHEGTQSTNQRL